MKDKGGFREMSFSELCRVVDALRGPDGCPWDRQQTHESLLPFLIEEVHEVIQAVEEKRSSQGFVEELGDVLLQVLLHSRIASESNQFSIDDVVMALTEKLIRRHPHVFGNSQVMNVQEANLSWEKEKSKEKKRSLFDHPPSLPALQAAQKIGDKSRKFNFDWSVVSAVLEKLEEEMSELQEAINAGDKNEMEMEMGDLLFTVVQVARHLNIDAESSLRRANQRFQDRFEQLLIKVTDDGLTIEQCDAKQLNNYWQRVKSDLNNKSEVR